MVSSQIRSDDGAFKAECVTLVLVPAFPSVCAVGLRAERMAPSRPRRNRLVFLFNPEFMLFNLK